MNKEQMIFELKDSIARLIDSKKLFPSMAEAIDKKIAAYDEIAMMLNVQEPCGDAVSRKDLERLKRWRFSYDTNTTIPKSDLFVRLTDIRALPNCGAKRGDKQC